MEWAYVGLSLVALACGYVGGAFRSLHLHRRTQGLEYRVGDLEVRSVTTINREKANRRWQKEQTMEEELAALGTQPAAEPRTQGRKYDNDPLG